MDESTANTTVQGSTAHTTRQRKTVDFTTNKATVKTTANWICMTHGIDQRTRIMFQKELQSRPHFTPRLANDVEMIIYQKSREHSWIYRKTCIRLLSMIDEHQEKWVTRVLESGCDVKTSSTKEIALTLLSMSNLDWLIGTQGYKAFSDLQERKNNFQKLVESKGGLDQTDPGSVIRCLRCKGNNIRWIPVQNRGADEPQTIKAYCLTCQRNFIA
jgi:DNA-directed RNA polymerase subunit M/transcription elongation factor TFIIS